MDKSIIAAGISALLALAGCGENAADQAATAAAPSVAVNPAAASGAPAADQGIHRRQVG